MAMTKEAKQLANHVFTGYGTAPYGCYIMDDGSVGFIHDPEFDPADFEDYDDAEYIGDELYIDGHAVGNMYIDIYYGMGDYYDGGCFIYYEAETLKDWCDRNGEHLPVKRIPDEVWDALEADDVEAIKEFSKTIPELKEFVKDQKPKKSQPKTEKSAIDVRTLRTSEIHPLDEEDFYSYDIKMARCPNCGIEGYSGADQKFDDISDGVIKCKTCGCVFRYRWNNYGIEYDQWDHKVFDEYREKTEKERKDRFAKSNVYVGGGMAYGPEHFDRYRYGGLFDFENPKDRSKILNFNLRKGKTRGGKKR